MTLADSSDCMLASNLLPRKRKQKHRLQHRHKPDTTHTDGGLLSGSYAAIVGQHGRPHGPDETPGFIPWPQPTFFYGGTFVPGKKPFEGYGSHTPGACKEMCFVSCFTSESPNTKNKIPGIVYGTCLLYESGVEWTSGHLK